MAHIHGNPDNAQEHEFIVFGLPRGKGDPDLYGYPGETEASQIKRPSVYARHQMMPRPPREYGDNDPADPEQNWDISE